MWGHGRWGRECGDRMWGQTECGRMWGQENVGTDGTFPISRGASDSRGRHLGGGRFRIFVLFSQSERLNLAQRLQNCRIAIEQSKHIIVAPALYYFAAFPSDNHFGSRT